MSLESILRIDSHRGVEQALFLAAGLMRDAAVVRPTKRIVIVLSDVFDSSTANRGYQELYPKGHQILSSSISPPIPKRFSVRSSLYSDGYRNLALVPGISSTSTYSDQR